MTYLNVGVYNQFSGDQVMVDSEKKTIISIFAHPDDELGAIGTLANHAERGDRIIMAWTTYGELTTLLPDMTPDEIKLERKRHTEEIAKIVGAETSFIFGFGDGKVENSNEQRVEVARFYAKEKPDAVISWGFFNIHSDHKNTGYLAFEAIKFARIKNIVNMEPHRTNVTFLSYYESIVNLPVKYIDITETIEKAKAAIDFYSQIYDWKEADDWFYTRRRNYGMEANCKYAEKFNVRFDFSKPSRYVV